MSASAAQGTLSGMRTDQIERDDAYHERKNKGENAVSVPCLTVARKLTLCGFDVAVSRNRAIREPAQRETGAEKYEHHSVAGRTHRNASPARSVTWASPVVDQVLQKIFAQVVPYQPEESLKSR
jgi:hypothetical protein